MIEELEVRDDVKHPPLLQNFREKQPLLQVSWNLIKTFHCFKINFLSYALKITSAGNLWKKLNDPTGLECKCFRLYNCTSKPDRSLGGRLCAWTRSWALGWEPTLSFWWFGLVCRHTGPKEHQESSVCIGRPETLFTFPTIYEAHS